MADHPFHPPVKRSVTIAGHPTSISLEPVFWNALEAESRRRSLPVNALVARIDVERMEADAPPNLTSAIRQWLRSEEHTSELQSLMRISYAGLCRKTKNHKYD